MKCAKWQAWKFAYFNLQLHAVTVSASNCQQKEPIYVHMYYYIIILGVVRVSAAPYGPYPNFLFFWTEFSIN